jgi:hypothetical protein
MEKERRKKLASLPFSEKLKVLEKLRQRSRAIAASGLRETTARQQKRNRKKDLDDQRRNHSQT